LELRKNIFFILISFILIFVKQNYELM